jgi:hypothetical protein
VVQENEAATHQAACRSLRVHHQKMKDFIFILL